MKQSQKQEQKREEIAAVFMDMLSDISLENLRTQDLCERAGVSKSTFYRLFTDKYELAFWIYKKLADSVVLDMPDLGNWDEWTYRIFDHMILYKAFYRSIASYRGQNCLYDSLAQYYRQNILKFRKNKNKPLSEDQTYAVYMFSIVNAQITIDWILNGFEPSAEAVQHRAELCLPACIRELYE